MQFNFEYFKYYYRNFYLEGQLSTGGENPIELCKKYEKILLLNNTIKHYKNAG